MTVRREYYLFFLLISACAVSDASGYNPVIQQVQTNLTAQGFHVGILDGILNTETIRAISAFQKKSDLPRSGRLDSVTLQKLAITLSEDVTPPVENWQPLPTQVEINALLANSAYADYVAYAPGLNMSIPGLAILMAMQQSADKFGSRHQTPRTSGYKMMAQCLKDNKINNTHWSDLTLHYYCQMSLPRDCYSAALLGHLSEGVKLSRINAYMGCANGELANSEKFTWVLENQALVFQYLMFGQTHAFNHNQEQAVINSFYGVSHPNDPEECRLKRPRRLIDPVDGTHCLVSKRMLKKLVGVGA